MDSVLEKMIAAAESGGEVLRRYFGESLAVEEKTNVFNFRTKADLESEEKILEVLTKNFPDYSILSEEAGLLDKKSEFSFILDPLDGTHNFILGLPYFSINLALLRGDEVVAGVVNNPILGRAYSAEKGQGAYLNGRRIHVNQTIDIKKATVTYVCGYDYSREYKGELIKRLFNLGVTRVTENWTPSLDMCLIASGKMEALIDNGNELYDFLPGKLIAMEAGARVTDFKGKKEGSDKNNHFLLSNGTTIHQQLLEIL